MESRNIVITGASSGIGRSAALYLDGRGHRIFATVRSERDAQNLRQAASPRLYILPLDVTDDSSIAAMAAELADNLDGAPLHGLVNNAGTGTGGPLEFFDLDQMRSQFEVNVFGLVAVTQTLLPHLRKGPGRIVNVGSIGGRITTPMMGSYCASKYAVEAISDALRMELAPWGLSVSVIEPGPVQTAIWDKAEDTYRAEIARLPPLARALYAEPMRRVYAELRKRATSAENTDGTDRAIKHALTSKRPKARYVVTKAAKMAVVMNALLSDRILDHVRTRM